MLTKILINNETFELLKKYKEQWKMQTYDDVIRKFMAMKPGNNAKSFRGYLGKNIPMKEILKDLRDKKDRY